MHSYYENAQSTDSIKLHTSLDSRQLELDEVGGARNASRKGEVLRKKKASQSQNPPPPLQSNPTASIFSLATPSSSISAFCQAVLKKIVPNGFWGSGPTAEHNESLFLKNVDKFISLRRFEGMSLHEVTQGMKVSCRLVLILALNLANSK